MDPIEVIVADVAKSTLTGCARSIVVELAERAGGAQTLADQIRKDVASARDAHSRLRASQWS